ncbi:MAG: hypothetical protein NC543_03145 [bacterium]|nr:hypothetical protein [bacterium]MCM1376609.1 hypothetical protein [Muribaculum sp.]
MAQRQQPANNKIRKYRKPLNLNIGMIIFVAILIYVVYCIIASLNVEHISPYEVKEGSLAMNYTYRGIAIRQENIVIADKAGYINYYAREGERVACGDLVYTVDETGRLNDYLQSADMGDNTLSERELAELKSEVINFIHGFRATDFDNTYNFKYNLKGTVMKLANVGLMQSIHNLNSSNELTDMVEFCRSSNSGIVTYWTDGYEELTPELVTAEMFDDRDYAPKQLLGVELITQGDAVYKLSTNENWSLVIPVEEEMGVMLQEKGTVKIRFLKNQYESWATVRLIRGGDAKPYVQLDFNNSMVTFATDRFVDIEIILNDEVGLKIPNSSIVQKDFYLVPSAYMTKGADGADGVILERYNEEGNIYSEFLKTSIYNYDEENKEYYLDSAALAIGSNIIMPDSQEKYTISRRATLTGVYNMNKGYADFRQINILYQNEEYAIVKSNTRYGLNVYDYIVLNAAAVDDAQFIY